MADLIIRTTSQGINVSGKTIFYQKQLIKLGGIWDKTSKTWLLPSGTSVEQLNQPDSINEYNEFEIHSPFKLRHQHPDAPANSRHCRYCHPEWEIGLADQVKAQVFPAKYRGTNPNKTILSLLTSENRYRNKFKPEMFKWFRQNSSTKWRQFIQKHLVNHLQDKPANDGHQTPYISHAIYPAIHITATCCRGCITSWHGFDFNNRLTDDQIQYLTDLVMLFLERYLLNKNNTDFQKWMTELPRPNGYLDPFYIYGDYLIKWAGVQLSVTKVGNGIVNPTYEFRKYLTTNARKAKLAPFDYLQKTAQEYIIKYLYC